MQWCKNNEWNLIIKIASSFLTSKSYVRKTPIDKNSTDNPL